MDPQANPNDNPQNQVPNTPNAWAMPQPTVVQPQIPNQPPQPANVVYPDPTTLAPKVFVGGVNSVDPSANSPIPPDQSFAQPITPEPPRKKSRLKRFIRGFLIGLVVIIVGLVCFFQAPYRVNDILSPLQSHAQSSALAKLKDYGSHITPTEAAKLNSADTFFAVFARTAQQNVVTTTSSIYFSNSPNDYSQAPDLRRVSANYATKQFSFESNSPDIAGSSLPDINRCIGDTEYAYLSSFGEDGWQKSDDGGNCSYAHLGLEGLNDNVNVGNLTSAQAQTFVRNIRNKPGLITMGNTKLVKQNGKNLIRFDVTVNRIPTPGYGYLGVQYFMWAFKKTGLDPGTWTYDTIGAPADGLRMYYYVDPTTQLPVYAQLRTTGILGDNGKLNPSVSDYVYSHVEYEFGGTIPTLNLNNLTPITLSWPTSDKP